MAELTWFQDTVREAKSRRSSAQEDVESARTRLQSELENPSKREKGVYTSRTEELAFCYGLAGTLAVLDDAVSGWADMATALRLSSLHLSSRSASGFANASGLDCQHAGLALVTAMAIGNASLAIFLRQTIQGKTQVRLPNSWNETPFEQFALVFASPPEQWGRLSAENPFAPLLRAESPEQFAAALVDYDQSRGKLVEQDPDGFSPFDGFPIALFPAEVIAIADVRGWRDQIVALEAPEFMASPLAQPPAEIACPTDPLLDAIADRIVELGGIRIPWN